ncbi:glycosyltransferase family 4 protein [Photobacterium sp. Hal280]|uniref:glycosyltransferase family 4 protein n=1 Tax=Photobacterium sp. Hal280 TaxID=3035163 RepID=UPI00301D427A
MKILFYIPSMAPAGGIERVVSSIVNKLSGEYEITLLTKDKKESFYTINREVKTETLSCHSRLNMNNRFIRMAQIFYGILSSALKLKKFKKSHSFDYIYITHPISYLECLFSGISYDKIVISEHGSHSNYNFVYKVIKSLIYKKAYSYCVPTKLDYDFYLKMGFPVRYTPHFKPELNYKYQTPKEQVVLNIGRFTEDKQQLVLLGIWKNVIEKIDGNWILKIVGTGELNDILTDYIDKNELKERVKLVKPCRNIEKIYGSSEIFALTSKSEGFGMVLLEAISFGMPVISFDCPSGPRDIINQDNGYLIQPGDTKSFENKLISLINNSNLRNELSKTALKSSEKWSDKKIVSLWKDVFI